MSLYLQVKGIWAYQAKQEYDAGRLVVGSSVLLKREEHNIHDRNAVVILSTNGAKLGYVPKEEAYSISRSLADGTEFRVIIHRVGTTTHKEKMQLDVYIAIDTDPVVPLKHETEIRVVGTSMESSICCICSKKQTNTPVIEIDGNTYCYRCSEKGLRNTGSSLWNKHSELQEEYDRDIEAFKEEKRKWVEAKLQATRIPYEAPSYAKYIAITILSAWIGYFIFSAGGLILGLVFAFFYYCLGEGAKDKQRRERQEKIEQEYEYTNPAPNFKKLQPNTPQITHIFQTDDVTNASELKYNRRMILKRDKYRCKRCGKKFEDEELEVHHVIPRSQGGKDIADNMISLCKYCHDREKWFGHVRKYPTTL